MQKVRYELDPYNRLIINDSGRKSRLAKFRKVLDGKFKIDKNNNLSYHVKAPFSKEENIPNQIKLSGEWSLTDNHDLRMTLDKSARKTFGDRIILQGQILDVNKNSLLFALTTTTKENTRSTYVLNIGGTWEADKNNRLSFRVNKEGGKNNILTFNSTWRLNKNYQIVYEYEKANLIQKKKRTHALTFRGHWDIKDKGRITYLLSGDNESVFNFEVSAGIFNKNYIQYEIGIVLKKRGKEITRTIKLSGKWKLKKGLGLVFEVKYGDKNTKRITFGAEMGDAFLKVLASNEELAAYAGAARSW